jgi:hypothetical protein
MVRCSVGLATVLSPGLLTWCLLFSLTPKGAAQATPHDDTHNPEVIASAFSLLVYAEQLIPARLFLKKSRTSLHSPVQSRSENALRRLAGER